MSAAFGAIVTSSRAQEDLAVRRERAERRPATALERPQGRAADMREDQSLDPVAPRGPRDGLNVEVATDTAGEADGAIPRRRLREHEVRASRPSWELAELRRPHGPESGGLDPVAARRMTGVDDRASGDAQAASLEGPRVGR